MYLQFGDNSTGLACCSSHAEASSFADLRGCGSIHDGYPYVMRKGQPALWLCEVYSLVASSSCCMVLGLWSSAWVVHVMQQNRVDCSKYFKENESFYGCSLSTDGPANFVFVASRSRPFLPNADYIGVRHHAGEGQA